MKLKPKLILFFGALAAAVIFGVASYASYEFKEILEKQTRDNLLTIAEGFEGHIFLFFEKNKTQISDWSSDGRIKKEFEEMIEAKNEKERQEKTDALVEYIKKYKFALGTDFAFVDIFDLNGKVLVSTESKRIGHSEPKEELDAEYKFGRAAAASYGETFISSPVGETGEPGHEIHTYMWHISVPLYSISGKIVGVMTGHIPNEETNQILSGQRQESSGVFAGMQFFKRFSSGEAYLVNSDKLMITSSKFAQNATFSQKADVLPVKECLENKKGFSGSYANYLGNSVEGASACLANYGLTLIAEIKSEEIFGELYKEIMDIYLIGAAALIFGLIAIYVFSNIFLKNVLAVQEAAGRAFKENFNVKVDVRSKDESGSLAAAFNEMISSIKKSRGELEDKINELEKFKNLTVGREMKMKELKEEIEKLKNQNSKL